MINKAETQTPQTEISTLTLGGVAMWPGAYLQNGSSQTNGHKPGKDSGYAFFDGKTLTLHNYEYNGEGTAFNTNSVGVYIPAGALTIRMEGDSSISVDALSRGIGLWAAENAKVLLKGKGSLTINVHNGINGNIGIAGDGSVQIKSGTLRTGVGLAEYTVQNGKKKYNGDSYAVYIEEFIDKGAHVSGNDKRGCKVNRNNTAQVTYEFSRHILWLPILLGFIAVCAIGVTVWALFFRSPVVLTPDYAPVEKEVNAEVIPDEAEKEKLTNPGGGGAVAMMYSIDVTVDRASGEASLLFGNPSESNQDVLLQIVVQDTVLAQSGTLSPGSQVQKLELLPGAADKLAAGGYDGLLRVIPYDSVTGEKAIMTNDIKVTVTVQ